MPAGVSNRKTIFNVLKRQFPAKMAPKQKFGWIVQKGFMDACYYIAAKMTVLTQIETGIV